MACSPFVSSTLPSFYALPERIEVTRDAKVSVKNDSSFRANFRILTPDRVGSPEARYQGGSS